MKFTWLWTGWATTFGRWIYHPGESYPQDPVGYRFRPVCFARGWANTGIAWILDIGPIRIVRYAACSCQKD